jgi:hypothetical protein
VDPKLFVLDPDPTLTFLLVLDPNPAWLSKNYRYFIFRFANAFEDLFTVF